MYLKELLKKEDEIYRPDVLKKILISSGISLKKRFGQNFLINKSIANYIVELLSLNFNDKVIEIGPGLGAITLLLAKRVKEVVAFEIDRGISRILKDIINVFNIKNVILINEDFLKITNSSRKLVSGFNKMVSNFPYSSGQRMIIKSLEEFNNISLIVGTLQREVAERFVAPPGNRKKDYGFISAWIQYISEIRIKKTIPPGNFFPRPEVDSSIVEIIPRKDIRSDNLRSIKSFIKCCFANKRKNLVNNILFCKSLPHEIRLNNKQFLSARIKDLFGDENIRAEQLTSMDFKALYDALIS